MEDFKKIFSAIEEACDESDWNEMMEGSVRLIIQSDAFLLSSKRLEWLSEYSNARALIAHLAQEGKEETAGEYVRFAEQLRNSLLKEDFHRCERVRDLMESNGLKTVRSLRRSLVH